MIEISNTTYDRRRRPYIGPYSKIEQPGPIEALSVIFLIILPFVIMLIIALYTEFHK